jgi:hypothetical protein
MKIWIDTLTREYRIEGEDCNLITSGTITLRLVGGRKALLDVELHGCAEWAPKEPVKSTRRENGTVTEERYNAPA